MEEVKYTGTELIGLWSFLTGEIITDAKGNPVGQGMGFKKKVTGVFGIAYAVGRSIDSLKVAMEIHSETVKAIFDKYYDKLEGKPWSFKEGLTEIMLNKELEELNKKEIAVSVHRISKENLVEVDEVFKRVNKMNDVITGEVIEKLIQYKLHVPKD